MKQNGTKTLKFDISKSLYRVLLRQSYKRKESGAKNPTVAGVARDALIAGLEKSK